MSRLSYRSASPNHPPSAVDALGTYARSDVDLAALVADRVGGVALPRISLRLIGRAQFRRTVAVVGARAATWAKIGFATEVAARFVSNGYSVISGGARGIDAGAHRGALLGAKRSTSPTAVVLGSGLDCIYPAENRALFCQVLESGGALLSPFPDDAPPRAPQFPARNRIIALLGESLVVVEAGLRSGALGTARLAHKLGRSVWALPGSLGCDHLIERGIARPLPGDPLQAALQVSRGDDLAADEAATAPSGGSPFSAQQAFFARIRAALGNERPFTADEVSEVVALSPHACRAALVEGELCGFCVRDVGGGWQLARSRPLGARMFDSEVE